jgi:hypothetical protein
VDGGGYGADWGGALAGYPQRAGGVSEPAMRPRQRPPDGR